MNLLPEPISASHDTLGPVMVIGLDEKNVLYVTDEGNIGVDVLSAVRTDWRYDYRTGTWMDAGPYEVADGDDEAADDWGSGFPNDVPGSDGADGRGESEGEGGADRDLDPGEGPHPGEEGDEG